MTDGEQPANLRTMLRALSTSRKIAAGVLALAAAIVTIWGAFVAFDEAAQRWVRWQDSRVRADFDRSPWLGLELWQGDQEGKLRDAQSNLPAFSRIDVELERRPFEFRFPRLAPMRGLAVTTWRDDRVCQVRTGQPVEQIAWLRLGTSLADTMSGSSQLFLSAEGHQDFSGTRVAPHSQEQQKITVFSLLEGQARLAPDDWPEDVYVFMFSDRNRNRKLDVGEHECLHVHFE